MPIRSRRSPPGALVLVTGWALLRESTHVLMEGSPRWLEPDTISAAMLEVEGVVEVHHLHLWNLASDVPALSAHAVLESEPSQRESQGTVDQVRAALQHRFAIANVTLQSECGAVAARRVRVTTQALIDQGHLGAAPDRDL